MCVCTRARACVHVCARVCACSAHSARKFITELAAFHHQLPPLTFASTVSLINYQVIRKESPEIARGDIHIGTSDDSVVNDLTETGLAIANDSRIKVVDSRRTAQEELKIDSQLQTNSV